VEVIISALPSICNSVLLYLVFLVFSAIFMLQLAVHSLEYTCKGPKYDSLEQPTFCSPNPRSGCIPGLFVPFDCDGHPEACTRATPKDQPIYPNFDDFAESLLTIFRISTLDGWAPALWHLQNAVGANVVFIFVVIIVLGPCVVVNLCIAAVLKHYSLVSMKKSQKKKDEEDVLTQLKMPSNHEKDLQDDICPACGALYSPDALYCRKCGISKVHSITSSDYDDNSSIGSTGKSERSTLVQKKNIWICTPRKEAVDWWHKNVNCHLSYGGLKNEKLRRIAGDEFSIFNQFMNLVICANVIMMACESFGQSTDVDKGIKTANVVFTVTFLLEMIFKVVVLGPGEMLEYGRSPIAVIDLFVVVLSTISLVFNSKSSSSVSVLRLLKLGRALRVLRMSRVSKRWHQVVAVVQLMRSSISRVWPMLFLFLLFLFMSTILAMQIFGDIERDGNFGFRTFGQSISMCFFVIALEDWGDVLEFANNGRRNGPQTLFFVAIVLFGQLLLLNLVLATIVDGAVEIFEDACEFTFLFFCLCVMMRFILLFALRLLLSLLIF
jgi:ribosomal protein L40E